LSKCALSEGVKRAIDDEVKSLIDECYEKFFSEKISLEEYYSLNRQICEMLKRKDD